MIIVAKSGAEKGQLEARLNKGARNIELHLFEKDVSIIQFTRKTYQNIKRYAEYINAVHIPIERKYSVEGLNTREGFRTIKNTCQLANMAANDKGQIVHVVMHQELSLDMIKSFGLYENIVLQMGKILEEYKSIKINLENLSVLDMNEGKFDFSNNNLFQNKELCISLREDLDTDRIGLVLDTCHALSTIRHLDRLHEIGLCEKVILWDYFREYSDLLNIIHLSNAIGFGYDEGHGTSFSTQEDIILLKDIMEYIKNINYKNLLTLEIREKDYLNPIAFEKLNKQVREILSKG